MSYRASLSTGTRTGGQSASAKHQYQNRQEKYLVGREGVRDDLLASGSGNLPAFAEGDAGKYWLAVDSFERKNARLFVELQLNLPRELSLEQQKEAVKNYMSDLCDKEKLSYSWVIHHGKDENPHAHVMINEQKNDSINRPAEQHFMRWNSKHPERGGAQKSTALKPKQWLMDSRAGWAIAANDALEAAGFERHFDHRSLKEQRISALLARDWRRAAQLDREVSEHEGPRVAGLRRKFEMGLIDRLPIYAKNVIESNNNISAINAAHLQMVSGMSDVELEQWERQDYFAVLEEREPARLGAEIEQLHSEALQLDALHDAAADLIEPQPQPTAQEHINEHNNTRAATRIAGSRADSAGGVQQHIQHLSVLQARRNNQLLREKGRGHGSSEQLGDGDVRQTSGDLHYSGMVVRETVQSSNRDENTDLHYVRGERVEPEPQPLAAVVQPEPQPEPEPERLDAHSEALEFADIVRRIEEVDLAIEDQRDRHAVYSIKAEHIKNDYQTLKRQQNALTASEANQNVALKVLNKLLKGIGFKSDSELIEPELERLSEAFNNAKSERELAKSQLIGLNKQRDELMQLDVSEPLREAARLRKEANDSAFETYQFARKSLNAATLDKSFRNCAERDLQMIRQQLSADDYTVEDMQLVQQQLEEFVDSIDAQLQKQAARQQHSQRPQSQPQDSQRPSGPRL